ncbi:MAG TPA: MFS transporter [Candidatus Didemnitutus sp.]|nr:MFS transporter [Candidatus Didemnitutus sp.]
MKSPERDPYSALRHAGYRSFVAGNFLFNIGRQALSLAVAWQIYRWTNSATALGLVGLTTVIPLIALVIPAGVLADRHDRRRILMRTSCASAVLSLGLVLCTSFPQWLPDIAPLRFGNAVLHAIARHFEHHVDPASLHFDQPALPVIFLIVFLQAIVRVVGNPARAALVPLLVPPTAVSNAVTWNASAFELSTVIGPALGGFLIWLSGYSAVYALDITFSIALAIILFNIRVEQPSKARGVAPDALAGLRFIWRHQAILAAISLDLFAVLLGGAIALLPIYGDKILHVDSRGIGWLRAAPALGAITMAFLVTHLPPSKRPGATMLWAVAGFGAAITLFALSRNLWLSLGALYLSGVCDNFSVVVRHSLVQMRTPDSLRGRVTAVNQLFIGSSNEISELRAGLAAAWYGPVAAATAGGVGTILVVVIVALVLPALRTVPPLHTLKPEED